MNMRIACIASLLLCMLACVQAAGTGSVVLYADRYCSTPSDTGFTAAGGLPTDGTCVYFYGDYYATYHRLNCTANGPIYEQFSAYGATGCTGAAQYTATGSTTTNDTSCLASGTTYNFGVQIQCTEKILNDRTSTVYYDSSKSSTCEDSAKMRGPIYGPVLGFCTASANFAQSYQTSSTQYCSSDNSKLLKYTFVDNKCNKDSWQDINLGVDLNSCQVEDDGIMSKTLCPSNPPSTAKQPIFPPTGSDVALEYNCYGTPQVTAAHHLGLCVQVDRQYTVNSVGFRTNKAACTQDGKHYGAASYNDPDCQKTLTSVELKPAGNRTCYMGSFVVCPATVIPSGTISGPLPPIVGVQYEKSDCTTSNPARPYRSATFYRNGCSFDTTWSANATTVMANAFKSSSPPYSCNGNGQLSTYGNDQCIVEDDGSSIMYTSTQSTKVNKFTIDTGSATEDSTRAPVYGSVASIQFLTSDGMDDASYYVKNGQYAECLSNTCQARASRFNFTLTTDPASSGTIITVIVPPSAVPGDVTPAGCIAALTKNGKMALNSYYYSCTLANTIYTPGTGGGPTGTTTGSGSGNSGSTAAGGAGGSTGSVAGTNMTYFGGTAKFSMLFYMSASEFTPDVESMLIFEMAFNEDIDESRITITKVEGGVSPKQAYVYFEVSPSTDPTVVTPNKFLSTLTNDAKDGFLFGEYISQAAHEAPTVTDSGLGDGKASAATISANFVTLFLVAIFTVLVARQ